MLLYLRNSLLWWKEEGRRVRNTWRLPAVPLAWNLFETQCIPLYHSCSS